MKQKSFLLAACLLLQSAMFAQTVTIGTATDYTYAIFNMQDPYTRYASLYTSGEIGTTGNITGIGWNVKKIWSNGDGPVKIYLKQTFDGILTSDTWANVKSGATVVYDNTADFPASGENLWQSFTLTSPFALSSGNLLVLVESNYGGTGNGGSGGDIDFHATGGMTSMSAFWWGNPVAVNGSVSAKRPLLQLTFDNATNVEVQANPVFSIYPNPVTDGISISIPAAIEANLHVEIINLLGECIISQTVKTKSNGVCQMALENDLAPGCYVIKASFNNTSFQQKFFRL
jgi:hypothetical protein